MFRGIPCCPLMLGGVIRSRAPRPLNLATDAGTVSRTKAENRCSKAPKDRQRLTGWLDLGVTGKLPAPTGVTSNWKQGALTLSSLGVRLVAVRGALTWSWESDSLKCL